MVNPKLSFIFPNGASADITEKVFSDGEIFAIVMTVPNFTNAVTITAITIKDADGDTYYSNTTGWAENATHLITGLELPVALNATVTLSISGDPGAGGGTVTFKPYIR